MPYAEVAHVKARAGFIGGAWTEQSEPATTDIEVFLQQVADELDGAVTGLGFSVPAADSVAAKALAGLNADGALLLALDATFPAEEGPSRATALQEAVRERYEAAWKLLLAGNHPATTAPGSTDEGDLADGAASFWTSNPYYGLPGYASEADPEVVNPYLDPMPTRGQPY
jgi:hypothetical protein